MQPNARSRMATWQVKRVIQYIDAHLTEKIRMDELAAVVQLSTSHFCRSFKATTGITAHNCILTRRIELAQTKMLTTDLTLSEIAVSCGMSDQPHLTKTFRRFVGDTPHSWRRNRQESLPPPY